jgi:hypothetical protein
MLKKITLAFIYLSFFGPSLMASDGEKELGQFYDLKQQYEQLYFDTLHNLPITDAGKVENEKSEFKLAIYDANNPEWTGDAGTRRALIGLAVLKHCSNIPNEEESDDEGTEEKTEEHGTDNDIELISVTQKKSTDDAPESELASLKKDQNEFADSNEIPADVEQQKSPEEGISDEENITKDAIVLLKNFIDTDNSCQDIKTPVFSTRSLISWAIAGISCLVLTFPFAIGSLVSEAVVCAGTTPTCPENQGLEYGYDGAWCKGSHGSAHNDAYYTNLYSAETCYITVASTLSGLVATVFIPLFGGVLAHASDYAIRKADAVYKNNRNKRIRELNQKNMNQLIKITGMKLLPDIVKHRQH